jgi:dienelactone hydrolase
MTASEDVRIFGDAVPAAPGSWVMEKLGPFVRKGGAAGLTAVAKLRGGHSIDLDPLVRLLTMRFFARRFYGALIDANGASYADVDDTMARIRSFKPAAWADEWRRTAQRFDGLGREAAATGRAATAVDLLNRASNYYRFAEMSLLVDSADREALQQASVDAYALAGQFMEPPLERVCLPVDGFESPAYVRVPSGIGRPPIVLVIPGLGMVKEHGDFPAEVLLARGLATMTVDLPGQGESRKNFAMDQASAVRIITAALDHLVARTDVDAERLGVIGTSLGAAAAILTAATDRRIKALVEIAGFYYPTAWWDRFPPEIKEFLRYVMGAKDQEELMDLIRPVNLQGHVKQVRCPLLVVHGMQDPIIPFSESDLIWAEATAPRERFIFSSGDHGCVNIGEARPLIGDWIAEKLAA